ncbi:MAG: hypothetical protein LIP09_09630 [Bacteroidales bacterium]|nr:hypothetical protein [Bacteroidales bacterium]
MRNPTINCFERDAANPFSQLVKDCEKGLVQNDDDLLLVEYIFNRPKPLGEVHEILDQRDGVRLLYDAESNSHEQPGDSLSYYLMPQGRVMYKVNIDATPKGVARRAMVSFFHSLDVMRENLKDEIIRLKDNDCAMRQIVSPNDFLSDFYV